MSTSKPLTPFYVGQKVSINLEAMKASNRWCKSPQYPSDDYLKKVEAAIAVHGAEGTVSHVFPPGYELSVYIGGECFHMKGHSWCHPLLPEIVNERIAI